MITINQIPLDNPAIGWELSRGTVPLMSLNIDATVSRQAGRDGVTVDGITHAQGEMRFIIRCPRETARRALFALFRAPALEIRDSNRPEWLATGRLKASSLEEHYDFLDIDEELFLVEIPSGTWRGPTETTALAAASALGAQLQLFPGLSVPVQDARVRLKGPLEDPQVTDTSGAFFALLGSLTGSEWLRFESDTGRAWITTTDTWTGGTEVSGIVDFGGPRDVFEITPRFPTPTDPTVREGRLTLTQGSYTTGAGFQVRGAPAFLM